MSFDWSSIPSWITQLIGIVVGVVVGSVITYRFSLKAQRRNMRAQYLVNNIEKTYVPIIREIQRIANNYRNFFGQHFTYGHYTIATTDDPNKYEFGDIRNQGYFEIVRSYNKKLSDGIIHFYDDIVPRLRETEEENRQIDKAIENSWQEFIFQKYAGERKGANLEYLGQKLLQKNKQILYNGQHHLWRIDSGLPLDERIAAESKEELIGLAKPHIQRLIEKHKQGLELLKKENVDQLLETLRKAIGNPI